MLRLRVEASSKVFSRLHTARDAERAHTLHRLGEILPLSVRHDVERLITGSFSSGSSSERMTKQWTPKSSRKLRLTGRTVSDNQ